MGTDNGPRRNAAALRLRRSGGEAGPLFHFLKINIFTHIVCIQILTLALLLRAGFSTISLVLLLLLVHPLVHFPETSFHLPGGPVDGNNEVKYQLVQQVKQESVEYYA